MIRRWWPTWVWDEWLIRRWRPTWVSDEKLPGRGIHAWPHGTPRSREEMLYERLYVRTTRTLVPGGRWSDRRKRARDWTRRHQSPSGERRAESTGRGMYTIIVSYVGSLVLAARRR